MESPEGCDGASEYPAEHSRSGGSAGKLQFCGILIQELSGSLTV